MATTAADATTGTAEPSEVGVGDADAVLESGAQRPAVSEEQAACLEIPQGVVGRSVWTPSPKGAPLAVEEEDEVEEIEHEGS